jgi:hypothetical protein
MLVLVLVTVGQPAPSLDGVLLTPAPPAPAVPDRARPPCTVACEARGLEGAAADAPNVYVARPFVWFACACFRGRMMAGDATIGKNEWAR